MNKILKKICLEVSCYSKDPTGAVCGLPHCNSGGLVLVTCQQFANVLATCSGCPSLAVVVLCLSGCISPLDLTSCKLHPPPPSIAPRHLAAILILPHTLLTGCRKHHRTDRIVLTVLTLCSLIGFKSFLSMSLHLLGLSESLQD